MSVTLKGEEVGERTHEKSRTLTFDGALFLAGRGTGRTLAGFAGIGTAGELAGLVATTALGGIASALTLSPFLDAVFRMRFEKRRNMSSCWKKRKTREAKSERIGNKRASLTL